MSSPRLPYDIILLDEAQDTNPLTLELVMAQRHATLVLVGDAHQGVYSFRKAMNAMERVQADERVAITQSFRFGQGIADVATALLKHFKGEPLAVRGRADIEVAWSVDRKQHYAVLGRTNAGLFTAAAELVTGTDNRRLHFIGGFDSYLFGKVLDAYYLWADERSRIKDASIGRFANFEAFREYGSEASDAEVKALVRTVELYRSDVPRVYNAIKAADTPAQDRAQVTLATGHRAKGLEWEQIELLGDFFDPMDPPEDLNLEEVNLLYVAVTRAIRAVQLPSGLTAWLRRLGGVAVQPPAPPPAMAAGSRPSDEEAEHERWLRENVDQFGAAAEDVRFLLRQLDVARRSHPSGPALLTD
jgi:superfamily I DNA/RNA helicase